MTNKSLIAAALALLILTGCSNLPKFDTRQVDRSLIPSHVVSDIKTLKGKTIMWGGTILSGKNFKDSSRLEVLAYPLDSDGWPERDQKPLGRFYVTEKGYLETADYAQGRLITVIGTVTGVIKATVGESPYTYPNIQSQQLHLWDKFDRKSNTGVHFGIGVMFH